AAARVDLLVGAQRFVRLTVAREDDRVLALGRTAAGVADALKIDVRAGKAARNAGIADRRVAKLDEVPVRVADLAQRPQEAVAELVAQRLRGRVGGAVEVLDAVLVGHLPAVVRRVVTAADDSLE